MPASTTAGDSSRRTQDLIFGTAVFVAAVLLFMLIYHTTRGSATAVEQYAEPPLSPNHQETLYRGDNIPPEEREAGGSGTERGESETDLSPGETKWNRKKTTREVKREESTYEQEEKVVKPEKTGGAL